MENQSIIDIAIQEDGSALSAFDWAFANGLSISDRLQPGQKLIAPISEYRNNDVVGYFKGRNQHIATAPAQEQAPTYEFGFPYGFPLGF